MAQSWGGGGGGGGGGVGHICHRDYWRRSDNNKHSTKVDICHIHLVLNIRTGMVICDLNIEYLRLLVSIALSYFLLYKIAA